MRGILTLLAALLIVVGCSESTRVGAPRLVTVEPVPTATAEPTAPPRPTAAPVDPEPSPGPTAQASEGLSLPLSVAPAAGMITAAGIPVAILAESNDGYLVRSPCGVTVEVSRGELLGDIAVVVDPGHGGPIDTGAVGPNGLVERDLNLVLSRAVEGELSSRGIGVVLTRTGDYPTTLPVRSSFADALGEVVMVSIHHNAPTAIPSEDPGTEVFIQSDSVASRRLGGVIYRDVFDALSTVDDVVWNTAADAGVVRVLNTEGTDAYGMIRRPEVPAVLVELGYLANGSEAAFMATDGYIEVAARGLADGIQAYLETDDLGTGFIDEPRVFNPAAAPGEDVCVDPVLE